MGIVDLNKIRMVDTLDFSEELKNFTHNGISLNLDER